MTSQFIVTELKNGKKITVTEIAHGRVCYITVNKNGKLHGPFRSMTEEEFKKLTA